MKDILQKIYPYTAKQAINSILRVYDKNGFVVSNFVYFAVIKVHKLFESTKSTKTSSRKTTRQKEYKKAIMKWDFLLPDGVALQMFYNLASKQFKLSTKKLSNLNGTDFIPHFLDEIKKRYWSQKICLFLQWSYSEIVEQAEKTLAYKWFNVIYTQDGYSELDRDKMLTAKKKYQDTLNILLIARSTPDNPIQELRTMKNWTKIQQNKLLVFTVWGLFDFWAAETIGKSENKWVRRWTQKRAPKFIRKLKLEWLWRLITDPKRNFKKVKNSFAVFPYILRYLLLKKE